MTYVVSSGVVVFGAGMAVGMLIDDCDCWYPCSPGYYSYGCAADDDPGAGAYYRGGRVYGPNGGAGWGAAYHSGTGTWSRAGCACGPHGSATVRQAYNPFTNSFASRTTAFNGYGSWSRGVVSLGDQWAAAGRHTNAAGTSHGWEMHRGGRWHGVSGGRSLGGRRGRR